MTLNAKRLCLAVITGGLMLPVVTHAADGDTDRSRAKVWVKDSVITSKIKTDLAARHITSLAHIKVDTDANGYVMLSGYARSQGEVDQAAQIAQAVKGVKAVDNQIKVKADL